MALDKFQSYLFVSAGEQSNKYLTPVISPDGIAAFQAQRAQDLAGLTIRIDPIQEGSGDPSPTNIRPISGRTGMTVTRAGRNLFNGAAVTTTSNGVTFTANADGSITANGTATGRATLYVPFSLIAGDYILSGCPSNAVVGSNYWMYFAGFAQNVGAAEVRKTLSANVSNVNLAINIADGVTVNNLVFRPMIRLASISDDTYEPYTAQTIPITWETEAGTVYGGTLDVVSGVLTVTHAFWTKNTATMNNSENYPGWKESGVRAIVGDGIIAVNRYVGNIGTTIGINTMFLTNDIAYLPKDSYNGMTQTQWKELAIDVEFVLPLATPQTYQLTPTEVRTIAGYNQVYSDAGPVIDIKF